MGKEELVADNTFYSLFAKKDARIELKKILLHFDSHIPPKVQEEFKKLKKEDFWNEIKPCLNLIENPDKMNFTDLLRPFISEEEKPRICPKCKSPYWDKPKTKFNKDEKK